LYNIVLNVNSSQPKNTLQDMNRVKHKPSTAAVEQNNRPDQVSVFCVLYVCVYVLYVKELYQPASKGHTYMHLLTFYWGIYTACTV